MSNAHAPFYKNAIWQYGLQVVKYLFPLATLPYLTRVLEPTGYAFYAYLVSFMSFVQVFIDFGFNLSGTKKIARAESVEAENRVIGAVTELAWFCALWQVRSPWVQHQFYRLRKQIYHMFSLRLLQSAARAGARFPFSRP